MLYAVTHNAEETQELGRSFGATLRPGSVVLLIGNLGAGKTTFAKGIIEQLTGTDPDEVTSPTYTLVHEFGNALTVYHLDLYRLETAEEVLGIGLDDLLRDDAVVLVEWGERFPGLFPESRYEVRLAAEEDVRRVSIRLT